MYIYVVQKRAHSCFSAVYCTCSFSIWPVFSRLFLLFVKITYVTFASIPLAYWWALHSPCLISVFTMLWSHLLWKHSAYSHETALELLIIASSVFLSNYFGAHVPIVQTCVVLPGFLNTVVCKMVCRVSLKISISDLMCHVLEVLPALPVPA